MCVSQTHTHAQSNIRWAKSRLWTQNTLILYRNIQNLYLAAPLAKTPEEKTQYIKNKAFDDQYYRDLIIKYLQQYGKAKKSDIRELLWDKLPDTLSSSQKNGRINTILTYMRRKNIIKTDSDNHQLSNWILV